MSCFWSLKSVIWPVTRMVLSRKWACKSSSMPGSRSSCTTTVKLFSPRKFVCEFRNRVFWFLLMPLLRTSICTVQILWTFFRASSGVRTPAMITGGGLSFGVAPGRGGAVGVPSQRGASHHHAPPSVIRSNSVRMPPLTKTIGRSRRPAGAVGRFFFSTGGGRLIRIGLRFFQVGARPFGGDGQGGHFGRLGLQQLTHARTMVDVLPRLQAVV